MSNRIYKMQQALLDDCYTLDYPGSVLELVERVIVVDAGKVVADGPKAQVLDALRAGRIKQTH